MSNNIENQLVWMILMQGFVACLLILLFGLALKVYPTRHALTYVHKNLYLDQYINGFYASQIEQAAARWSRATNNLATFDVRKMPANPVEVADDPDAIVVTIVPETNTAVITLDKEIKATTLAYCNMRLPLPELAYVDTRVDDVILEKITLHELGHALGLQHPEPMEDGIDTLMYPHTDLMSSVITQEDLEQFCKIYLCNANNLQNEEEPLHL